MLENSIWKQYNEIKSIHEVLVEYYALEPHEIVDDEQFLYNTLKSHLTKKELRYFVMQASGMDNKLMQEELHVDSDTFDKIGSKVLLKFRRNKLKEAFSRVNEVS